jgi:hypothetical protein
MCYGFMVVSQMSSEAEMIILSIHLCLVLPQYMIDIETPVLSYKRIPSFLMVKKILSII